MKRVLLQPLYDAATVNLGAKWCTPNISNFKELLDNCSQFWIKLNGIRGIKFGSSVKCVDACRVERIALT